MKSAKIILGALLVSSVFILPASAASLLGGAITTGGPSSGTSASVPSVAAATVSGNSSNGTNASGTVLNGGGSTVNVGLDRVLANNSNASVTLPGSTNNLLGGNTGDTVNGVTGNGGSVDTLLGGLTGGDTVLGGPGNTGANGGIGNDGLNGDGTDGNQFASNGSGDNGINLATGTGPNGRCINNAQGMSQLLQTRYDSRSLRNWSRASAVRVVPIKICAGLRASVKTAAASSSNIGFLRGAAAADPTISKSLSRNGHSANDVLAVGQTNGTVTVYVY